MTSLKILTKLEYDILKSAADRIAAGSAEKYGLDLAQKIDAVFAGLPPHYAQEFKLLLKVFEFGPPLFGFIFQRFTRMNSQEKDRYLRNWETSGLAFKRMGFQAIKRITLSALYGSEETWREIGYRGPWLVQGYAYNYDGKGVQVRD